MLLFFFHSFSCPFCHFVPLFLPPPAHPPCPLSVHLSSHLYVHPPCPLSVHPSSHLYVHPPCPFYAQSPCPPSVHPPFSPLGHPFVDSDSSNLGFAGAIKIYALDFPAAQVEYQKNLAWKVENGELILGQWGDCFIPHTPGNMKGTGGNFMGETVSLEHYSQRGYYIMQKNYGFIVRKKGTDKAFSK